MGVSETRPIHICQNVNLLTWPREQLSSVSIQAVVKRPLNDQNPWEDTREETSERVPEDKVHPTIQNKRCHKGDDVKAVSSSEAEYDESSSNSKGSDSDNPFDLVMRKLSINSKETISAGGSSDNAYLTPISKVIDDLELLMAKELSEVSSDPAMQFQLHQLLDRLNTNNHHKVKEAIVEFRRKASASFQEFEATVDPLNKLKNFEEQKARIQKDSSAGSTRWNDLRNSIKKASSDIKAKNRRKKELELEIANSTKELQQIESDVKNQEAACLGYLENCRSLDEQARALSKKADDLLAANRGVENEGEAAKVKQNRLKLNWSTHLPSMLNDIKISILSPS
ncbi:hypothetical protein VNO77_39244 [Canavalia gladiata]|uniref:Uncharacterized protein n=1 Tax=Canavalia gladiata TaxID=3824 RepID=A0AAN9KCT1_CANGL